ncbi:MAG TPA: FHA domain-containing protein [Capillimicrobium sp.]|nr:FHA domain-containing protein [Capillimicrobium sp.]
MEPVSVLLKYGFLVVLYLFLLWVSRNALKDLRASRAGRDGAALAPSDASPMVEDATGLHSLAGEDDGAPIHPQLVVERAPGHESGLAYDIGEGAVMGRGDGAEIRLEDPFASSRHARLVRQGGIVVIEDLGSTNGTYLNEELLSGPQPLHPGDRIRIGDSEFTYEDR